MKSKTMLNLEIIFFITLLSACSIKTEVKPVIYTQEVITNTVTISTVVTPTVTATIAPTTTPSPTVALSTKDKWNLVHEQERIELIKQQGVAHSIPALEYHGDHYSFSFSNGGKVYLNPESFEKQMKWLHDNNVHAVTGDELIRWYKGEIDLPYRSIILTFDLGNRSRESITRMLQVFEKYNMHGLFTIWVFGMNDGESVNCPNDSCWQIYRDAYNSGMATIGSHTISHHNFSEVLEKDGLQELAKSKQIIEDNIRNGCVVSILTWPFEAIPSWGNKINTIGFEIAFGGNTYPILRNAAQRDKPNDWYKLPRVLPPNSSGFSGRPNGRTLEEMMIMYWDIK